MTRGETETAGTIVIATAVTRGTGIGAIGTAVLKGIGTATTAAVVQGARMRRMRKGAQDLQHGMHKRVQMQRILQIRRQ